MIYARNIIADVITRKLTAIIRSIFLFTTKNLSTVIAIQSNQKLRTTLAIPRLVTMSWYRRWRWTAKNLSTLIAVMVNKETPARSQPKDSDTAPATQCIFTSPAICEMRHAENEGWANSPTARSNVAQDINSALEGVWSDGVFHTASITSTFPMMPGRRNTQFRIEQIRLWTNKYSGSSTESVKNRQGFTGSVADWFWFIVVRYHLRLTRFLYKLVWRWTRKFPLSWTKVGS